MQEEVINIYLLGDVRIESDFQKIIATSFSWRHRLKIGGKYLSKIYLLGHEL